MCHLGLESEDLSNRIAVLASQGGLAEGARAEREESKVVVLFGRWSQFRTLHMCVPELGSEDLSNRIAVLASQGGLAEGAPAGRFAPTVVVLLGRGTQKGM